MMQSHSDNLGIYALSLFDRSLNCSRCLGWEDVTDNQRTRIGFFSSWSHCWRINQKIMFFTSHHLPSLLSFAGNKRPFEPDACSIFLPRSRLQIVRSHGLWTACHPSNPTKSKFKAQQRSSIQNHPKDPVKPPKSTISRCARKVKYRTIRLVYKMDTDVMSQRLIQSWPQY